MKLLLSKHHLFGINALAISMTAIFILALFATCKKTIPDSKIETSAYIHSYPEDKNQVAWYLKETKDGGFLVISTEDLHDQDDGLAMAIYRMNAAGNILSKNVIRTNEMCAPVFTNLPNGNILVNCGCNQENLCLLDPEGKVIFLCNYFNIYNVYSSYPLRLDNGSYAAAVTNGSGSSLSTNLVAYVDSAGKYAGYDNIPEPLPNFKTLYLSLHKCWSRGNYLMNGWCFPNWNGSFRSNRRIFLSRKFSGANAAMNKTVVVDTAFSQCDNISIYQVYTHDNFLVLAASQLDAYDHVSLRLIKADDSLNVKWIKTLDVGTNASAYCITELSDGGFLMAGSCTLKGKANGQPFVCKASKDGDLLWSKIYNTKFTGYLQWGEEVKDGGYLLFGAGNFFGQGATQNDLFTLKTDAFGNVK
jgi:hypothetical protein